MDQASDTPRSRGAQLITLERLRQMAPRPVGEDYDSDHDAQHADAALAKAGYCYVLDYLTVSEGKIAAAQSLMWPPAGWPWLQDDWKPTPEDPVRQLVKAGALIAAEIDRLLGADV